MAVKKPDFSGWATKANLVCSDGRTIMPDAFKHQDTVSVPLVWQHDLNTPENILGHAILTNKPEGVWCDAYFNDSKTAKHSKMMVQHKNITQLSIRANQLVERAKQVFHGMIREVSLVIAGANEGARIVNVALEHADGSVEELEEAIIFSGEEIVHSEEGAEEPKVNETEDPKPQPAEPAPVDAAPAPQAQPEGTEQVQETETNGESGEVEHANLDDAAMEVYNSLDEAQQGLVHYMVAQALQRSGSAEHSNTEEALNHNQEGTEMTRNIFDQSKSAAVAGEGITLTHEQVGSIMKAAESIGSLKKAVAQFATTSDVLEHGINDIELLFPEARLIGSTPEWEKRRTEWVAQVLNAVNKRPYARIKTQSADITQEEARAKGYIKGNLKKEEWFSLRARTTTPTWVYKKQKLDREDIIDITEFDVVVWMKGEMRLMTEEEVARAILLGDGRPVEDPENPGEPNPDKIKDPAGATSGEGIRSILNDHELFVTRVPVEYDDTTTDYRPAVEAIMLGMEFYKGSGRPVLYTTLGRVNRMLLSKDTLNRRLWKTRDELATEMGVGGIVDVEVMDEYPDVLGIIVNLTDYSVGTDRGGEMTFFEDFDIDYNQNKYLYETRLSGALTRIKSAIVVTREDPAESPVTPNLLAFDPETNTIDFVAQTGVIYSLEPGGTALAADEVITEDTIVYMRPDSGYYFTAGSPTEELYEYQA